MRHFKHLNLSLEFLASAFTLWYPNNNNTPDSRTKLIVITAGVFSEIVIPAGFFSSLSYCTERNRQMVSDALQGCVWSIRPLFTIHHEFCATSLIPFTSSMRNDWRAAAGFIQPFTSNAMRLIFLNSAINSLHLQFVWLTGITQMEELDGKTVI